jgi:hypothetical protein
MKLYKEYEVDGNIESFFENMIECYYAAQDTAQNDESAESNVEEKNESEEDVQENSANDSGGDYERVKEHMHMVLARYAKEGIIDYKEAAQIHDVIHNDMVVD